MRILKFGGSSVASPDRIRQVAAIVERERAKGPVAVVVSAFGGVTDALLEIARAARAREASWETKLAALEERHREAVAQLAAGVDKVVLQGQLEEVHAELRELARGISLLREASPRTLDRILSAGERISAATVAAALRAHGLSADAADARELIRTDAAFGGARVQEEETRRRIRAHFADASGCQVVTGFIASTEQGETTTLGRGGSDYTAAILGDALDAEAVELWTDVDGVMTSDPRVVEGAQVLDSLAYDELMEMAHWGAKVVHPPSVHPTRKRGIPLYIKNTFRPDVPGTKITATADQEVEGDAVRGLASIPAISLLRLEGDGMIGVPGVAMRLFGALARHGVSVIMISQASSEHSICVAVAPRDRDTAARAVHEEFGAERHAGLVEDLVIEDGLAVVAAVGAGMRDRPGVAGRVFDELGRHDISIRAIAQGSSELNVSLVVSSADEKRALNVLHEAFFDRPRTAVRVYLAGPGGVGGALLDQIAERSDALKRERNLFLRIGGVARSQTAVIDPSGMTVPEARERLDAAEGGGIDELVAAAKADPRAVFIDCTASGEVAARVPELLRAGVRVVSANKLRPAGTLAEWRELRAQTTPFRYETTVGAALPVLSTLDDLVATGDRVESIEGVLSGTLAYVLDQVGQGVAFSAAVRDANDCGFTEPDPREDLGGNDVGRKILILARLAGHDLEPEDVEVEPLLPASPWFDYSIDEFWEHLPEADAGFAARQAEAAAEGRRLVYLAQLTDGTIRVGLQAVAADHPAAGLRGTDSLVAFRTTRYDHTPLVVRGPGAGPELTASGVFADVLRVVQER